MVSGPNRDRVHYDDVVSTIPAVTRVEGLKHNWLSCFFAARVFGRKALSPHEAIRSISDDTHYGIAIVAVYTSIRHEQMDAPRNHQGPTADQQKHSTGHIRTGEQSVWGA